MGEELNLKLTNCDNNSIKIKEAWGLIFLKELVISVLSSCMYFFGWVTCSSKV